MTDTNDPFVVAKGVGGFSFESLEALQLSLPAKWATMQVQYNMHQVRLLGLSCCAEGPGAGFA